MPTSRVVLASVHQHVDEAIAYFSRRTKRPRVKSFGPHPAASMHHAVERASETNDEPRHPARQRDLVVGLDQEVDMVVLHGKMENAKPGPSGSLQRFSQSEKRL